VKNFTTISSDTVLNLCILQDILKEKSDRSNPDFIKVAAALHIESNDLMTEWRIYTQEIARRLNVAECLARYSAVL